MQAGKLNSRITIQKRTQEQLPGGQPADKWIDVKSVWAWHKPLNGRTGVSGNIIKAINGNSWRIRFNKDLELDTSMRVSYSGKYFRITRIVYDYEGRDYIDLICEEGGKNG